MQDDELRPAYWRRQPQVVPAAVTAHLPYQPAPAVHLVLLGVPVRAVAGLCLVLTLLLLANLMSSRLGRDMRLVREDETAAGLSGVNVVGTRVLAFTVSAACAGLAGGLFAYVNGLASPGSFPLSLSLALLTAAVLGGLGSLAGALYGAVLVTLLPVWLADAAQSAHLPQTVYANLPLVAYGVVLIAVITLFPAGLHGALRRLLHRLVHPKEAR